ncbi:GNAT family N-acetyltransferase [Pseudokineococcus sp. 1T1Z-3]|uniref:GNAT family N-acetyltransferase n=1 Tax=Pseudokineococcus sp. 1T1Z-3 TaxID=3132745 RepID=UPI0030AFBD5C
MATLAMLSLPGREVVLRRAVADDVPAVVALLAADQLGAGRDGIRSEDDHRAYLAAFGLVDADPAQLLVVATEGEDVVATLQLTFLPGLARRGALRAQLEAVRVRSDHRGTGLGSALVEWAVEEAGRRGCALVQLTSDKTRGGAHQFYERLGFVASHEGLKLTLPR